MMERNPARCFVIADNTATVWRVVIASLSMLAAIAVYVFARLHPPALLEPFQATHPVLIGQTFLLGSAPSFFYTLSIGLLIGAVTPTRSGARLHCLLWIGLAGCFELSQLRLVAEPIGLFLSEVLPGKALELVAPFWTRGTFDPLDLVATVLGGALALAVLTYLPREHNDEGN